MLWYAIQSNFPSGYFFPIYTYTFPHQKHNHAHSRKVREHERKRKYTKETQIPTFPFCWDTQNHRTPTQYTFTYSWCRCIRSTPLKCLTWHPCPAYLTATQPSSISSYIISTGSLPWSPSGLRCPLSVNPEDSACPSTRHRTFEESKQNSVSTLPTTVFWQRVEAKKNSSDSPKLFKKWVKNTNFNYTLKDRWHKWEKEEILTNIDNTNWNSYFT